MKVSRHLEFRDQQLLQWLGRKATSEGSREGFYSLMKKTRSEDLPYVIFNMKIEMTQHAAKGVEAYDLHMKFPCLKSFTIELHM